MSGAIWRFIFSALAIWRVTHLFAEKDGPGDLIVNVRSNDGAGFFKRLIDCFLCLSLWISLPLTIWLSSGWIGLLLQWQALSGAACLTDKYARGRELTVSPLSPMVEETPRAVFKSEAQ